MLLDSIAPKLGVTYLSRASWVSLSLLSPLANRESRQLGIRSTPHLRFDSALFRLDPFPHRRCELAANALANVFLQLHLCFGVLCLLRQELKIDCSAPCARPTNNHALFVPSPHRAMRSLQQPFILLAK